jgi:3-hydroxyisobutyrate dehydrogenase-like beta-hydroxyacid dehydrogenase
MADWAASGGNSAATAADVASQATRLVLAVFDTQGVLAVLEGPNGVLHAAQPRAVIDCSTGDPDLLQALAARLAAHDTDFLEAPLSGSSVQITAGQATVLLGATPDAAARHADLLDAIAPQRVHVGGAGMGARAKLATNLVLGLNRAALAEGMVFAESMGIAPLDFLQLVLATPARSDAALAKGARMVAGDFAPPQSRIHQHLKDLRLMQQQAAVVGQRLPLTDTHAALLQAAVEAGDGALDNAAVIRQLRRLRG